MDKEIKDKWVKALNSEKYKQTTGFLKDEAGYCCLGVLCQIYRNETKNGIWKFNENNGENDGTYTFNLNGCSSFEILPKEVMEWAKLNHRNPNVYELEKQNSISLAELNDEGSTFKEIAKVIMEQL